MTEPSAAHDLIARQIVDSAFAVHCELGPGLLETAYEQCLAYELGARGIEFRRQVSIPVTYRNAQIEGGFRMDMLVGSLVIVEVKSVERTLPIHEAQLLTYLKLSRLQLGFLINFNVLRIKDGIRRFARTL